MVCSECGRWADDRPVVGGAIACECGARRPFELLPLYVVTGASAAGKSTVGQRLFGSREVPVILDADILWSPEMDTPEDGYARFRATLMRLVANIHQSNTHTMLIGSGVPEQFYQRPERRYIGEIHWVALVCDDEEIERRLRARPPWRGVTDSFIASMQQFNAHLRARSDMRVIDTSTSSVDTTVHEVLSWLRDVGWQPPAEQ